jgi:YD repeat-containing protein
VLQNGWSSGYSPTGNVQGYTDSVMGQWSFGYDGASRLVSATASPAVQGSTAYTWTYDSYALHRAATRSSESSRNF